MVTKKSYGSLTSWSFNVIILFFLFCYISCCTKALPEHLKRCLNNILLEPLHSVSTHTVFEQKPEATQAFIFQSWQNLWPDKICATEALRSFTPQLKSRASRLTLLEQQDVTSEKIHTFEPNWSSWLSEHTNFNINIYTPTDTHLSQIDHNRNLCSLR